MVNQVYLQDALASIENDDFKSVHVVINPFEDKEHGVWVSIFDLLQHVANKKNPHEVLKRIGVQHPEVLTWCENLQFSGPGQRMTPIMPLRKSVKLLQLTPGEAGSGDYRASSRVDHENVDFSAVPFPPKIVRLSVEPRQTEAEKRERVFETTNALQYAGMFRCRLYPSEKLSFAVVQASHM
jgi:hypothetical protein